MIWSIVYVWQLIFSKSLQRRRNLQSSCLTVECLERLLSVRCVWRSWRRTTSTSSLVPVDIRLTIDYPKVSIRMKISPDLSFLLEPHTDSRKWSVSGLQASVLRESSGLQTSLVRGGLLYKGRPDTSYTRTPVAACIYTDPQKTQRSKQEDENWRDHQAEDAQLRHESCSVQPGVCVRLAHTYSRPRTVEKAGVFREIWEDPPDYHQPRDRDELLAVLQTTGLSHLKSGRRFKTLPGAECHRLCDLRESWGRTGGHSSCDQHTRRRQDLESHRWHHKVLQSLSEK